MALIEIYHVVADMYPVDPTFTTEAADAILEGQFVRLEAVTINGSSVACVAPLSNVAAQNIVGIAGDTLSNSTASTPYTDSLFINGSIAGQTRSSVNRVSDFYNETGASGLMTVYTGGGKFATDVIDLTPGTAWASCVPGTPLYVDNSSLLTNTNVNGALQTVGFFVKYGAEPSGVPGTDAAGSTTLGNYVTFIMDIGRAY